MWHIWKWNISYMLTYMLHMCTIYDSHMLIYMYAYIIHICYICEPYMLTCMLHMCTLYDSHMFTYMYAYIVHIWYIYVHIFSHIWNVSLSYMSHISTYMGYMYKLVCIIYFSTYMLTYMCTGTYMLTYMYFFICYIYECSVWEETPHFASIQNGSPCKGGSGI